MLRENLNNDGDGSFLRNDALQNLLGIEFLAQLLSEARDELLPRLVDMISERARDISTDDDVDEYFDDLASTIYILEEFFKDDEDSMPFVDDADSYLRDTISEIRIKREELELEKEEPERDDDDRDDDYEYYRSSPSTPSASRAVNPFAPDDVSIFDDIDEGD
ncbi:MAG: hypothetical protein IPL62_04575 [Caulobacteraceae bacterium]|nr:hypothetical protein [Caulobacteraceae bacterium]